MYYSIEVGSARPLVNKPAKKIFQKVLRLGQGRLSGSGGSSIADERPLHCPHLARPSNLKSRIGVRWPPNRNTIPRLYIWKNKTMITKPPEPATVMAAAMSAQDRVAAFDWAALTGELDNYGCAVLPKLLTPAECRATAALYPDESCFRSRVIMARHGFGLGEYRYFSYPLPDLIFGLRTALYPHLADLANAWNERMGIAQRYPGDHASFLARCHEAGQTRPTPLLLQYVPGDYNCLHQDLYGDLVFPIQVAILLSEPGEDFTGGEFRPDRAETADAKPGRGRAASTRRRRGVRGPQPTRAGLTGKLPRKPSPRRKPCPLRPAAHCRDHLPRCKVSRLMSPIFFSSACALASFVGKTL